MLNLGGAMTDVVLPWNRLGLDKVMIWGATVETGSGEDEEDEAEDEFDNKLAEVSPIFFKIKVYFV